MVATIATLMSVLRGPGPGQAAVRAYNTFMVLVWVLVGIAALIGLLFLWGVGALCYLKWRASRVSPVDQLTRFSDLNKEERTPR